MSNATETVTLTEFLLARIAEDEASARTAAGERSGRWASWNRSWDTERNRDLADVVTGERMACLPMDLDEHIARHSPARVLAECEAKRQIVEFHRSWPVLVETPPTFESDPSDLTSMTMRVSQQIAWTTEQKYREHFGTEPPSGPIIRALAAVYSDHPDYRDEWRP